MSTALSLILLTSMLALAPGQSSPAFGWLSGHWEAHTDQGLSEEVWTSPEGGLMLGLNRTIWDGQVRAFEFLRISLGDDAALYAQPGGRAAVRFALAESGEDFAVFENPNHDYPQRIAYRRDGDVLTATISDINGEKSRRFQWRRKP